MAYATHPTQQHERPSEKPQNPFCGFSDGLSRFRRRQQHFFPHKHTDNRKKVPNIVISSITAHSRLLSAPSDRYFAFPSK
ncbi:hypothetical protein [Kingella potus]|uniref:hypothetical protein n=1 Tax=Kingella potus TaxID=265175 RepID=UPI0011C02C63|nr:hypothetical protein [Kingella potus]UOP00895.1 hypothetical protein LVJ84_00215 [Kingella potus]